MALNCERNLISTDGAVTGLFLKKRLLIGGDGDVTTVKSEEEISKDLKGIHIWC